MQLIYEILAIIVGIIATLLLFKIIKGMLKVCIFVLAFALILFSSWYAISATENQDLVTFAVKKISLVQDFVKEKYAAETKELKEEIINTAKEKTGELIKETFKSELNNTINALKN